MAIHLLRNAMQAVNPLRAGERIARWLPCQRCLPVAEAAELRLSQVGKKAERGDGMGWIWRPGWQRGPWMMGGAG